MLELLYKVLISAGLLIIAVQLYMNYVNTRFMRVVSKIIRTNEILGFDAAALLKNLDPFMSRLNIKDYGYYVFFLNTEYSRPKVKTKNSVTKFVYTSEYTVLIDIEPMHNKLDSQYPAMILTEVIFLLIMSDISIQIKSAEKAFKKSMELQTFINHDVKNLIQFINVLEFNLDDMQDEKDYARFFKYLKRSIPGLKSRSDKILSALNSTQPEKDEIPETFSASILARIIADSYGVELKISLPENFELCAPKKSVSIIFENIIKNFYDKSITEKGIKLFLGADENENYSTVVFRDNGSGIYDCEKIFEPFYSDKANGLGIGLFHCRNVAENIGGRLWAENTAEGPVFKLMLRKQFGG